ncbi:MAG: phosphate regulon sensor histidine kinase PhoR [Pseudomonadota bacterium]
MPPSASPQQEARSAVTRFLRQEFFKVATLLTLAALAGSWLDQALLAVALVLAAYLCIHIRNLALLRVWVEFPKRIDLPESDGLWGEAYEHLLDMRQSHRKRKKKLSAILAEFQSSTEALPDGAVVLGPSGEIIWFNSAAQALLGLRSPQDVGIRVPNLIRHPEFTEYFARGDYKGDAEVPSAVNRAVTLSLRLIPYGNGQRLLIVRDVSELKRVEIARRDFVANASHELRTPLTVLRGYLEMMEPESRSGDAMAPWRAPLAEMRAQAVRMETLIADMLKLARLESDAVLTRQDVIDVPLLLDSAFDEVRKLSQGRHRFSVQIECESLLFGRESEVLSIFTNLLHNAVHYTPEHGRIDVRWWSDEEGAHFSVEDQGIGIAEKDIPRLTERFYRVDVGRSRASGGTGLGLSIVKHALERHEGHLQIISALGAGSTFIAHFPSHRLQQRAAQAMNA